MKAISQRDIIANNFFEFAEFRSWYIYVNVFIRISTNQLKFENFQNNEVKKKNSFHGNIDTNQQTQWNRTNIRCWSQCCNLMRTQ